jgi:UDP-N-acetylglucosamine 3-dehydrogenase
MASHQKLRAGVIGGGAIAQACHLPGYAKNKYVDLVAVADPVVARHREALAAYPGIATYKNYQAMLRTEDLDVVSVCTPNVYHAKQAIASFEAGCHVLCEKPMALSLDDADAIIAAGKAARRKLMIGFTHRTLRGNQKIKTMLADRAIGKPFMMRMRLAHGGPIPGWAKDDWFYNKRKAGGGALLDMGIHAIDLCNWFMGPVKSVSATTATIIKKIPVDDNAVLNLEFKSGALGYIEVGWTSKPGFTGTEIYGTKGSLINNYLTGLQFCSGKASAGTDDVTKWTMLDEKPATGGWPVEIDLWIDVIRGKEKLTMTGKTGRDALAVALAAYESSKTGRRVNV